MANDGVTRKKEKMFDLERDLRGYDMIEYLAGKRFFEIVLE
jgi:hypothetical protein